MTAAPDTTDGEAALRRRLADIAAATTVDPEAMDKIRQRTAVTRPTRWRLATVAAAIVLVVGAVVLTQRDRGSQVKTDQDRTTTTTDRDPTTTTTTAPSAPLEPGAPPAVGIPGGATGGDAPVGSGLGRVSADGRPAPTPAPTDGGTAPASPSAPAAPAPGPAVPSEPTAPDGRVPTVTLATADYELQVTAWHDAANGAYYMNIWRSDGSYVTMWNWSERPGQNCLGGSGLDVAFGGTPAHAVDWGLVRADATEVRLVSTSQIMARAQLGPEVVPGLRAWIGEEPLGQLDHVEARDAGGNVLHVASASSAMDAWPDTC